MDEAFLGIWSDGDPGHVCAICGDGYETKDHAFEQLPCSCRAGKKCVKWWKEATVAGSTVPAQCWQGHDLLLPTQSQPTASQSGVGSAGTT